MPAGWRSYRILHFPLPLLIRPQEEGFPLKSQLQLFQNIETITKILDK